MPERVSRFRAVIGGLIALCLVYLVGGGLLALLDLVPDEQYIIGAGVVGGFASVLGMLSLTRPALNNSDISEIEINALRKLADTSEEIKQLEQTRVATQQQLVSLEEQKRQMEFLVQKASLSLFLEEQHRLYERRIQEAIANNRDLQENVIELMNISQKLEALNEEIERDPNVDLLMKIVEDSRSRDYSSGIELRDLPPLTRSIFLISREFDRFLTRLLGP